MTTTTNDIEETSTPACPLHPSDVLLNVVVTLLAPIFFALSAGDISLARMAALETINAYRARDQADLIAVAQIIGFGLAALGSLSLSLADDLSTSMIVRLRSNANACHRSAEQNRRALTRRQAENAPRPYTASEPVPAEHDLSAEPDVFLTPEAAQLLAAESLARLEQPHVAAPLPAATATRTQAERRHQDMWAIAMVKESSEITASIPNLPPTERKVAEMRAALLSSTAHDLINGPAVPSLNPGALAGMPRQATSGKHPPR